MGLSVGLNPAALTGEQLGTNAGLLRVAWRWHAAIARSTLVARYAIVVLAAAVRQQRSTPLALVLDGHRPQSAASQSVPFDSTCTTPFYVGLQEAFTGREVLQLPVAIATMYAKNQPATQQEVLSCSLAGAAVFRSQPTRLVACLS